jgi:hypothetical protein
LRARCSRLGPGSEDPGLQTRTLQRPVLAPVEQRAASNEQRTTSL